MFPASFAVQENAAAAAAEIKASEGRIPASFVPGYVRCVCVILN